MSLRPLIAIALFSVAALGLAQRRTTSPQGQNLTTCADSAKLTLEPALPARGAIFLVRANGVPSGTQLEGRIAGQPLHFVPQPGGGAVSFAATSIDGSRSLDVALRCITGERVDTLNTRIELASGDYPVERLSVAPRFGRAPDSAVVARTERESRRALDVAKISHTTPRLWDGEWQLPRSSRITSVFGSGREFNGTITSRHMGTDFAGATGAPVHAINRGIVRIVDNFYYGGNVVYIDHGDGVTSAYLHLSRQDVAVGDTVERGAPLGVVGATGRVTGPHLHLIVRYGSVTVDPMSLFAIAGDSSARRFAGASQ